jgi:DNA-directed RNA polymerase specialized sigma24 family protein
VAEYRAPLASTGGEMEGIYRGLFSDLVRRLRWKFGLPLEDARDLVQDAFTIALVKLDPSNNPRAWLNQVVDYLAVNWCRKAARRAELLALRGGLTASTFMDDDIMGETLCRDEEFNCR